MSDAHPKIISDEITDCPFCREPLHVSAVKCPSCLEFLPHEGKTREKKIAPPLASYVFELAGKALIPVTILIVAFGFRSTLTALIGRASEAQFLGTKLVFSETAAFKGSLAPSELYYLIGSAREYGQQAHGALNYDVLKREGRDASLNALQQKGLVNLQIIENTTMDTHIFGNQGLVVTPTEKGKEFLIELGLTFDGKTFVNAP